MSTTATAARPDRRNGRPGAQGGAGRQNLASIPLQEDRDSGHGAGLVGGQPQDGVGDVLALDPGISVNASLEGLGRVVLGGELKSRK